LATGIYGFPIDRAAALAMAEVRAALGELPSERSLEVVVCAYTESDAVAYEAQLQALDLSQ
jgi:O-acetyl-ADP-ribose deacetylase (regulator of RNase III)